MWIELCLSTPDPIKQETKWVIRFEEDYQVSGAEEFIIHKFSENRDRKRILKFIADKMEQLEMEQLEDEEKE